MMKHRSNYGYAIVVVLVLLVIGTVSLILFNRESSFFTKVSGLLSRNKKIHAVAENGLGLAKGDLRSITYNSNQVDTNNSNTFANLLTGGKTAAINQGLFFDETANRELSPRITRDEGDFRMRVFYFPENPCLDAACNDDDDYNKKLPKRFLIVSEASNLKTGEIFSIESRIQIKLENFAEIAFATLGAGPYPHNPSKYNFAPSVYGRTHFDLPPNKLHFTFDHNDFTKRDQQHNFLDLVTFQKKTPSGQDYPFTRQAWGDVKTVMNFKKGFDEDVKLYSQPGDSDYNPLFDPQSDAYFDKLKAMSNSSGINLDTAAWLPACGPAGRIDVCLKFKGGRIYKYDCNYIDSARQIMGRVDQNIHPQLEQTSGYTIHDESSGGYDPITRFNGTNGPSNSAANWPERYVGERAEVYTGTSVGVDIGPATGVIHCNPTSCPCNVEVKGIIQGQVTVAAKHITIGGDLQYQNQNPNSSADILGLVAKEDIIIPPGIPQAATTAASHETHHQEPRRMQAADAASPIGSGSTSAHYPSTLSESYLNITNFIPHNGSEYVDRDFGDQDYKRYASWIHESSIDTNESTRKYYNSPMALDIDAVMVSKRFVVDGIFNPGLSGQASHGVGILTCENPTAGASTGVGCSNYKYRDPQNNSGSGDALYKPDGTLVNSTTTGTVLPLFHGDGLERQYMTFGGCVDAHPQNCSDITNANRFRSSAFQPGEELPRPSNHLLKIFGGVSSQFFLIHENLGNYYGKFKMGFKRKIIQGDPRTQFLSPPGFPPTLRLKIDELYQKTHMGKSPLITN